MTSTTFVPVHGDDVTRGEIASVGYSRRPLRIDDDVAKALHALADEAWKLPRDQYYGGGDRFRRFNRYIAEIGEDGVTVGPDTSTAPYEQLERYNTTLGGTKREYQPLEGGLAYGPGLAKIIAHHLASLPMSRPGGRYNVNLHLKRFLATPGRACDTSPPGLHKDGEKYLATHLLSRCGVEGGEVVITDNKRCELERFVMKEMGECYVFDDEKVWHMLTPVATAPGNAIAFRDVALFDILPEGWRPH